MLVPVAYDLMTGTLATRTASVDLAPSARELDIELGWSAALSPTIYRGSVKLLRSGG